MGAAEKPTSRGMTLYRILHISWEGFPGLAAGAELEAAGVMHAIQGIGGDRAHRKQGTLGGGGGPRESRGWVAIETQAHEKCQARVRRRTLEL